MHNTYKLVPTTIVGFAEESRVQKDAGYQIVERCLRNAVDSQTKHIKNSECHIVLYNNKPSILVHHQVCALMKSNEYSTSMCFNDEDMIACKCECKAGCEGNGRVLCVHVLPLIYQITHLLFDGLADNILVEYANRWKSIHDYEFINDNHKKIKEDVILLMTASQQYNKLDDELDLYELAVI
jgi:hypothetical protein